MLAVTVTWTGCSGEENDTANGTGVQLPQDSGTAEDSGISVATDAGQSAPNDGGATRENDSVAFDQAADCPGGFSCTCTASDDCDSGYCIDGPDGQYCTQTCADTCPSGFKCVGTSVGSDIVNLCVPTGGFVCNPCKKNAECVAPGHGGARCVDHGDAGAFCGLQCNSDSECPSGYGCSDVDDVTGAKTKQCVLASGACACSNSAVEKELSTVCYKTVGAAKCAGERTCLAAGKTNAPPGGGLSACLAQTPVNEKCDGIDNDCDGETDEATCDDSKPCTVDACDPSKGCAFTNKTGPCDADGTACTKSDTCKDGKCIAGPQLNCDDKNPCTMDTCDSKLGCQYQNTAAPCDADNNPCTVADICKDGTCQPGAPKPCASGQPCVKGACSISDGICKFTTQDGFPCDDGDPCSAKGKCAGEVCKSLPLQCDDKNPCTADSCAKVKGCQHTIAKGSCEDGDPCTAGDSCALENGKLVCFPGQKKNCDDNNPCTTDSCDKAQGCKHTADVGVKVSCYPGKPGSEKNTPCKAGVSTCQADGTAGTCEGAVTPKATETCGNKIDDDCNGAVDDACGKQSYVAGGRLVNTSIGGVAGQHTLRGVMGASIGAGSTANAKYNFDAGFYRWLSGQQ